MSANTAAESSPRVPPIGTRDGRMARLGVGQFWTDTPEPKVNRVGVIRTLKRPVDVSGVLEVAAPFDQPLVVDGSRPGPLPYVTKHLPGTDGRVAESEIGRRSCGLWEWSTACLWCDGTHQVVYAGTVWSWH